MITEAFWCAEYKNGLALPEYDLATGKVNKFAQVDHKNVLRFWWIPVTPDMIPAFPNLRFNPLLKRHCVETKGSRGYVARRVGISLTMGKSLTPPQRILCYVLGIEGGPRREIYPSGLVLNKEYPSRGESQDLLHG